MTSDNGADIVIRSFARVPAAALAAFSNVPSSIAANLCDGCVVLPHSVRRLCGEGLVVGSALTASAPPGDVVATFVAISEARAGDILMLATGGGESCAVIGDRVGALAVGIGVGALVTDGLIRDLAGLRDLGLPVHAAGLSPKSPSRKGPARVGGVVTIGGVAVSGGDLIVADEDGVAIVPADRIDAALAALPEALRQDAAVAQPVRDGVQYPLWLEPMLGQARRNGG